MKFVKRIFFWLLVSYFGNAVTVSAQHVLPVSLFNNPDSVDVAIFGEFKFDGSTVSEKTWTSGGQAGFTVHTKPKREGLDLRFTQIIVDFNPIIIGWDPFNWNTLIQQSVDSFYVQKMPFSGDAFLHMGVKRNLLRSHLLNRERQKYLHSTFADFYWRPYNISKDGVNYRFQTVNLSTGYQFGYLQRELPVLGALLFTSSLQLNYISHPSKTFKN
ncbi:MAG: hypothetical protein LCH37_12125 [Bacteroidetes bacterium]|nr:hypothetical protein [Bacteroidota bacterium]